MPTRPIELSASQARRIALHAQGFGDPRPTGRVDRRHVRRVLGRIGLIQIDSVNVLVRSQEMPLFARLGPHPRDLLPRMAAGGELFEYWCHEASLLPIDSWPLLRWKMERRDGIWGGIAALASDDPGYVAAVLDEVRARGPLSAGELTDPGPKTPGMWGWSRGKRALEYLFWSGEVTARRRAADFARVYDLTDRVIPAEVRALPAPSEDDARRALLAAAGRALGVATLQDLCDYHRLNVPRSRHLVGELVEEGALLPARVEGWDRPALMHAGAHLPRRLSAQALLSPFDSLVWERSRAERLFGFRYRIEIYTPADQRVHGYYVLPFLLGEHLVARVDLKADRAQGALLVQGAFGEAGHDEGEVAGALAAELATMAAWLGLERVLVRDRGDLAPALAAARGGRPGRPAE